MNHCLKYKCSTSLFSHYLPADMALSALATLFTNHGCPSSVSNAPVLSDLRVFPLPTIDAWFVKKFHLAIIEGRLYPFQLNGEHIYVKGINVSQDELPHVFVDTLRYPFQIGTISIHPAYNGPLTGQIPPTIDFILPSDKSYSIVLGGMLIDKQFMAYTSTGIQVTLPPYFANYINTTDTISRRNPITDITSLLSHPGTFIITHGSGTQTTIPVFDTGSSIVGIPTDGNLPLRSINGEILPYRPVDGKNVMLRQCISPMEWVTMYFDKPTTF